MMIDDFCYAVPRDRSDCLYYDSCDYIVRNAEKIEQKLCFVAPSELLVGEEPTIQNTNF